MDRYALPKLGRIPVGDVETRHVKAVLLPIAEDGKLVQAASVGRHARRWLDDPLRRDMAYRITTCRNTT